MVKDSSDSGLGSSSGDQTRSEDSPSDTNNIAPSIGGDDIAASIDDTSAVNTVTSDGISPSMQDFRSVPSIAPPRPEIHAVLEALGEPNDDQEMRDDLLKREMANFKGAPPIAPPLPDRGRQTALKAVREPEDNQKKKDGTNKKITSEHLLDGRSEIGVSNESQGTIESCSGANNESFTDHSVENSTEEHSPSISSSFHPGTINSTVEGNGGSDARCELGSPSNILSVSERDNHQLLYSNGDNPIEIPEAYLVESMLPRFTVHAERIPPWYKRMWGRIMIVVVIILVCALISTLVLILQNKPSDDRNAVVPHTPTGIPSLYPSSAPSFDPSPTLEIIRGRALSEGGIRCGLADTSELAVASYSANATTFQDFNVDLCRAVASVVLGDPDKIKRIPVTAENRFIKLRDRDIDLLLFGDSHTLRREVFEKTSETGFSFSSPYFFSGVVYVGEKMYVECAEANRRYGECVNLTICCEDSTLETDLMRKTFPPSFLKVGSSYREVHDNMVNGRCNVAATDIFKTLSSPFYGDYGNVEAGKYTFSNSTLNLRPLAMVTRRDDLQWSNIVEGVLLGLLKGWQEDITQDVSSCPVKASNALNISFESAPMCVGNYNQLFMKYFSKTLHGMGDDFTTGLIYSLPIVPLDCPSCKNALKTGTLKRIKSRGWLNCAAIYYPENEVLSSLSLMNELYCRAVAAAIFNGDFGENVVNITRLSSVNDSLTELNHGSFDIITGLNGYGTCWSFEDFAYKLKFSTPYYLVPNEENINKVCGSVTIVSYYDQDDKDIVFSSFVNAVVTATIHAAREDITKDNIIQMPIIGLFGDELQFMLKDVVSSIGNYDEIYDKSHNLGKYEGENASRVGNNVHLGGSIRDTYIMLCRLVGKCY